MSFNGYVSTLSMLSIAVGINSPAKPQICSAQILQTVSVACCDLGDFPKRDIICDHHLLFVGMYQSIGLFATLADAATYSFRVLI